MDHLSTSNTDMVGGINLVIVGMFIVKPCTRGADVEGAWAL